MNYAGNTGNKKLTGPERKEIIETLKEVKTPLTEEQLGSLRRRTIPNTEEFKDYLRALVDNGFLRRPHHPKQLPPYLR